MTEWGSSYNECVVYDFHPKITITHTHIHTIIKMSSQQILKRTRHTHTQLCTQAQCTLRQFKRLFLSAYEKWVYIYDFFSSQKSFWIHLQLRRNLRTTYNLTCIFITFSFIRALISVACCCLNMARVCMEISENYISFFSFISSINAMPTLTLYPIHQLWDHTLSPIISPIFRLESQRTTNALAYNISVRWSGEKSGQATRHAFHGIRHLASGVNWRDRLIDLSQVAIVNYSISQTIFVTNYTGTEKLRTFAIRDEWIIQLHSCEIQNKSHFVDGK